MFKLNERIYVYTMDFDTLFNHCTRSRQFFRIFIRILF